MRKKSIAAVGLFAAAVVVALILMSRQPADPEGDAEPAESERDTHYITSAGCRECHSAQYESWHDSYHRTMTQKASVTSVVAPIDDVTVSSRGRSYRFYRKGDQFRVQMVDPDWEVQRLLNRQPIDGVPDIPTVDREIVMTTGSHHYQAYWIKGRFGNELRQVPFVYHIATKQWIPREDSFLQLSSHEREFALWNDNCIDCHAVGGYPGFNESQNQFESRFVELGIACESCHGPGGRHAEAHRRGKLPRGKADAGQVDSFIVNPAKLDNRRSAAVCGQCHVDSYARQHVNWNKEGYTKTFRPGELLDESRVVVRYEQAKKLADDREIGNRLDPGDSSFWKDGTHRVGGREYNGLIESACYQKGKLSCLSCHSLHNYQEPNDQLKRTMSGNASCLQCHEDYADKIAEHTHHPENSSGSQCQNCHMPHTTYALFKGIRSHRIDSPSTRRMAEAKRPNACNLCHIDQTLEWTVKNLHRWYNQPEVTLGEDDRTVAASLLWMLKGDAAERAIAVWNVGWKPAREAGGGDWVIPYVAELLDDPYAAIRFMAARTLENSGVKLDPKFTFIGPRADRRRERERIVDEIVRNPAPAGLYCDAIRSDVRCDIADSGALIAYSGKKTGRSPSDKRVVIDDESKEDVWWGDVNISTSIDTFEINYDRAIDYLNTKSRLYCIDGFAGWDPDYRLKVRVVCSRPYHALFMQNMLMRPSQAELADFGEPDTLIINAGEFPANQHTTGMTSKTSIMLSLELRKMVILGTEYAGEMKKGVFTLMNYLMPKNGVLSMHCSATADRKTGRSSVLFGLSGTGKTTLSADPRRELIGDDEHGWSDNGIFNIEGGCYAKAIDLSAETEPEIFQALRFGAVLENVVYDPFTHVVDFSDVSITQNTRGAYPIEHVANARIPCVADHPSDVIFLTCDAFGVLPPVSKLSPAQAMYHFISGYTAKVAGTEVGVTEPEATFSPCFGGPFLVWHPAKYAELLAQKLKKHGANAWLVNTGWTGGKYGTGSRMKLSLTRALIDAIHDGTLADARTETDPVFGLDVVLECPGVPAEVLRPRDTWAEPEQYDQAARHLAGLFRENFRIYEDFAGDAIRAAGPVV
eukprot:g26740.t1